LHIIIKQLLCQLGNRALLCKLGINLVIHERDPLEDNLTS